jgi:menaquinone-dependent protoporphyrinogen oxidase
VLAQEGHTPSLLPAAKVRDLSPYDAVMVGGALYANRWHRDARRYVARHVDALRRVPVWCFPAAQSGKRCVGSAQWRRGGA